MDRATGETYAHCLDFSQKGLDAVAALFQRRDRHVMSDSDTAVLRGERCLATKRPDTAVLQGFCRLHRISSIATNGIDKMLKDDVTGIINIALSLKASGAMRVFRRSLRAIIRDRLVVLRGSPGPVADLRRAKLLDAFCPIHPGDGKALIDRAVVELCANGNWDNHDVFEVYVAGPYDRDEIIHYICVHFVKVVAGKCFRPYPRSRWTGARGTLERLGLLMNIHGLFEAAHVHFCKSYNVTVRQVHQEPVLPIRDADGAQDAESHLP
eukprot:1725925-Pyramimonas_sp.AAC.1